MKRNIESAKRQILKLKNKISDSLKGHQESEDFQIAVSLVERDIGLSSKDFEDLQVKLAEVTAERDNLYIKIKNQNKEIDNINLFKKVSKECIQLFRKVIYSERFIDKELMSKTQAATKLLELTIENGTEKNMTKK